MFIETNHYFESNDDVMLHRLLDYKSIMAGYTHEKTGRKRCQVVQEDNDEESDGCITFYETFDKMILLSIVYI